MQNNARTLWNASKLLSVIVLTLLCFLVLWRFEISSDVNSQLKRIQAAKLPTSGDELNAWRLPVSDNENGALILTQAFSLKRTFTDKRSQVVTDFSLLERTNLWSLETAALVSEYIQTNQDCLEKVRDALRLPHYRYPADFSFGPDTPLPHLWRLKELAQLIALKVNLNAINARLIDWLENVELSLKLASTLDGEPSAISQSVRNSIIRMAAKSVEKSLNTFAPNEEAMIRIQEWFAAMGKTNMLQLALIGERARNIAVFRMSTDDIRHYNTGDGESDQDRQPHRLSGKATLAMRVTGFFERDLSFYLQTMEKAATLSSMPLPDSLELTNLFHRSEKIASDKFYFFSSIILPSLSSLIIHEADTQARTKLAQIALALERFRKIHGRLPAELTELAPQFIIAVPFDPFTGQPFKYRQLSPKGYVVYSVDRDGRDDGGREPPSRKKSTDKSAYDITFTVER